MEFFEYINQYIRLISVMDIIDVAIVSYLLYKLIKLLRNTTASKLLKGICFLVAAMQVSRWLGLNVINFLFRNTLELGFIAVVILFQPELRKVLEQVGRSRFFKFADRDGTPVKNIEACIADTVEACSSMSVSHTGALIVFERNDLLNYIINTGTAINAQASPELIMNMFYPKAPLHDGAVIMRAGRLAAAGCVLPLSQNMTLSRDLGTRHRAAVGMSEESDAVCVIVSEETGSISVASAGMLKRHLSPETLGKVLKNELIPNDSNENNKVKFAKWGVGKK